MEEVVVEEEEVEMEEEMEQEEEEEVAAVEELKEEQEEEELVQEASLVTKARPVPLAILANSWVPFNQRPGFAIPPPIPTIPRETVS